MFFVSRSGPAPAGTFAFTGLVAPRAAQSKVLMLSHTSDSSQLVLRELNMETFVQDREQPVGTGFGSVADFVEVRPGLYAFHEWTDAGFGAARRGGKVHLFAASGFE